MLQISLKLLLVIVIFIFSILVSISITLTLYFTGLKTVENEVSRLANSNVLLSIEKLEAKLSRTHQTTQSVANATVNRISELYPTSDPTDSESIIALQSAITATVRLSALMQNEWIFPAYTTRYKNGDTFFLRANQILLAKSPGAFWNGTNANTPRFAPLLDQTRFMYNFSTLEEIPTTDWSAINVGKTTFVDSPNWNASIAESPSAPNFLQVLPTNLIFFVTGREQIFFYLMATTAYQGGGNAGSYDSAQTMNSMLIFLDFIAYDVK